MKRTALFLAGILAISSLSGCGAKNSASDSSEPFEGKYVVTADYVKENLDDIIVVDARGEDEAKKGTVKVQWQRHGSIWQPVKTGKREMQTGDVSLIQSA